MYLGQAMFVEKPQPWDFAAGADSVNLRVHVPGVSVEAAREQIALLGSCGIRFDVDVHDR